MTKYEEDFVNNFNDYLTPIPNDILKSIKRLIGNQELGDLIASFYEVCEDSLRLQACEAKAVGSEKALLVKDALERYLNYVKILVKTEGFKTCNF